MQRKLSNRVRLKPQNTRLKHVDHQHQFYAKVQQMYMNNTLVASGITCSIFKWEPVGVKCTCSQRASLLDDNGDLTPSGMLSIANGVQQLYGETKRVSFTVNDLHLEDIDAEPVDEDFHQDVPITDESVDLLDFGGYDQQHCAICYGSGYVNGLTLSNGIRRVYDTQAVFDTDHKLITSHQPYYYENGTYFKMNITLPLCHKPTIRVFNNTELVNFELVDIPNGKKGVLHIRTDSPFTHVVISEIKRNIPTDFPQIPDDFSANMLSDQQTTTFIFDNKASITKNSLIKENKFGRIWQVTEVNPHFDNRGILVQYEVTARLTGQHEIFYTLMSTI